MQGHPQTMLITALFVGISIITPTRLLGHEVDHFNLPLGKQWVDQGEYWNSLLFEAVAKAVAGINRDIEAAEKIPLASARRARLGSLRHPSTVTFRVRKNLPSAFMAIERLEMQYRLQRAATQSNDVLIAHKPSPWNSTYGHAPLLPDPRQFTRMTIMRCSLIQVHGQKMGTDKIGHFIAMGYYYYVAYSASRAAGNSHDSALEQARRIGVDGPISEKGVVGMLPTGVISNADLVANYAGMKFYLNVTQPVMLKGVNYPPMLIRNGNYWKLQSHVTRDSPYFSAFISEHYDEALNPCVFEPISRGQIRNVVQKNRDTLLSFYAGDDEAKMTPRYFAEKTSKLKTYYGEDYGHVGDASDLIYLADILFEGRSQLPRASGQKPHPQVNIQPIGPREVSIGGQRHFAVAVTNLTDAPLESLQVSTSLPTNMAVRHLDGTAEFDRLENEIHWKLQTLAPRETELLRFQASAVAGQAAEYKVRVELAGAGTIARSQKLVKIQSTPVTQDVPPVAKGVPRQRIPQIGVAALPIVRR